MPKGVNIGAQTHQQINDKIGNEEDHEHYQKQYFLNGQIIQIQSNKHMIFESLAGCVREQKRYQKHINNDTKIHCRIDDKSMQNLCSKK